MAKELNFVIFWLKLQTVRYIVSLLPALQSPAGILQSVLAELLVWYTIGAYHISQVVSGCSVLDPGINRTMCFYVFVAKVIMIYCNTEVALDFYPLCYVNID